MIEVLAVTTNFGFGPVSKLCAILKGILKKYGGYNRKINGIFNR